LQEQKDEEIQEFMDSHAESKFKASKEVKKKYQLKIALATKSLDTNQLPLITESQNKDLKTIETEMQKKSASGKHEIKEKFNQLASKVNIDAYKLVCALLGEEVSNDLLEGK
jgi:hypothetical protein